MSGVIHFGSGLDTTVKICHKNGLAFTLIFGMHDEIIFELYTEHSNFGWGLSHKKIESHGHKFYTLVPPSRRLP